MAFAEGLDEYSSEEEFTDMYVVPWLRWMGYSTVDNYHGTQEFGKDLVVSECDRLENVRYHGVQVKYKASISQRDAHGLVDDCEEAFTHEFVHPQTGGKHRISTFYVINAGTFSDNARTQFFGSVRPKYGDNAHLIAGKALVQLLDGKKKVVKEEIAKVSRTQGQVKWDVSSAEGAEAVGRLVRRTVAVIMGVKVVKSCFQTWRVEGMPDSQGYGVGLTMRVTVIRDKGVEVTEAERRQVVSLAKAEKLKLTVEVVSGDSSECVECDGRPVA